jgi:nitrogenase-stabilizing/protective protein
MSDTGMQQALDELSSAEEFLDYFGIAYDAGVVQVNRLHILQRFHDYIERAGAGLAADETGRREAYRDLLARAYGDFVASDARTEKVFRVFHLHEPQTVFVPADEIFR